MKENKREAKQGDKIAQEFCPTCNEELIVKMNDGGSEVFECEHCKFKIKKK